MTQLSLSKLIAIGIFEGYLSFLENHTDINICIPFHDIIYIIQKKNFIIYL